MLIKITATLNDASRASAMALYGATRGTWKVSRDRARRADFALAVYVGGVREVYRITEWLPAGSRKCTNPLRDVESSGRWEFVGNVAEPEVRDLYRWRSVTHL